MLQRNRVGHQKEHAWQTCMGSTSHFTVSTNPAIEYVIEQRSWPLRSVFFTHVTSYTFGFGSIGNPL